MVKNIITRWRGWVAWYTDITTNKPEGDPVLHLVSLILQPVSVKKFAKINKICTPWKWSSHKGCHLEQVERGKGNEIFSRIRSTLRAKRKRGSLSQRKKPKDNNCITVAAVSLMQQIFDRWSRNLFISWSKEAIWLVRLISMWRGFEKYFQFRVTKVQCLKCPLWMVSCIWSLLSTRSDWYRDTPIQNHSFSSVELGWDSMATQII